MSGMHQALLLAGAVADTGGTNALNAQFDTTSNTTSATYVDILEPSAGGSIISASVTKAAGTNVLIIGGIGSSVGSTSNIDLAVNDGTTDWILGSRNCNTSFNGKIWGTALITGLGAGSFTFKLRWRTSVTAATGSSDNFFIFAMEVGT